ncbi:MAG TPA: DUF4112 domain-containing protein [Longimicrobiales bacterium]
MPSTALERLRTLTRVMDDLVPIPGTRFRFGLDPIIGLVPGLGDAAGAVFAGFILLTAWRAGAPAAVLLRMAGNIVVDTVVGAVPVLGDIFDFGWKANRRNLRLLERWEAEPIAVHRGSRFLLALLMLALLALLVGAALLGYLLVRWLLSFRPAL